MISIKHVLALTVAGMILTTGPLAIADEPEQDEDEIGVQKTPFDPEKWTEKAITVLDEQIEKSPDKRIPKALLGKAKCVVLFPRVVQGGIGIGGKLGRGMVSCRNPEDGNWGTPVFLNLTALNWGLQLGAQSVDLIMLIMNDKGLETLFSGKPIVGVGAGIAAGPVGREVKADIDVLLQTPILTYARSKGLYAGAVIEGATILPAKDVNTSLYGEGYGDARSLLKAEVEVPEPIAKLQAALARFAPSPAAASSHEGSTEADSQAEEHE